MVELLAELKFKKFVIAPELLLMVALPAELTPWKFNLSRPATFPLEEAKVGLFVDRLAIPFPVIVNAEDERSKEYGGAPLLNWRAPTEALSEKVTVAEFVAPNVATPVGTVFWIQFGGCVPIVGP
jgi:hypothetical protein